MVTQETSSLSGVVADAEEGGPCLRCVIRATRLDESYGFTQAESAVASNGSYAVRGLLPGSYRIAVEKDSAGRRLASSQVVEIANRNLTGVNLLAGVSRGFSSRIVFDAEPTATPGADPRNDSQSAILVVLTTPEGIGPFEVARVEKDRTFQFSGLSSEEYVVQVQGCRREDS